MRVAMPLDTGAVPNDFSMAWPADQGVSVRVPSLDDGRHVGEALRLIREFHGLSIEDVAQATRIRRLYLHSIETLQLQQLPSRPFTIGYVRAYAVALGLDGDLAVRRFKHDAPDPNEPLRAPVGVRREGDPRLMIVAVCGAVVICGILIWNFAERAMAPAAHQAQPVAAAAKVGAPPPAQGPAGFSVGAPLPPPQESTTPKPYIPPGLEAQMSGANPAASGAGAATQATAAGLDAAQAVGAPFVANGVVYGDAASSNLILQARKPASITVHRADGSIAFARFLSAGQAYRAPTAPGWTVEVSEPASVDVFVNGALKGPMPSAVAPLASLVNPAPQ